MEGPFVTWNLFFTPVVVAVSAAIIIYFIQRRIDKSYEGWTKYQDLKEKTLQDWQYNFSEECRGMREDLTEIKERVVILETKIDQRNGYAK